MMISGHFGVFSYEMANFHNKEARAVSNPRLVLHISPQSVSGLISDARRGPPGSYHFITN